MEIAENSGIRVDKDVYNSTLLPPCYEIEVMDEIDDIEGQVVVYPKTRPKFKKYSERNYRKYRSAPCEEKSRDHCTSIRKRINDRVSGVALCESLETIVLYYYRRIFYYFPCDFDAGREDESLPKGKPWKEIPEREIEKKSVDDVAEGIPVGKLLRIFRAIYIARPEQ
jgi:hypothetical protein